MAYNPNIPQPTDQISVSQGQILNNFQALNPFILGIFDLPPQATPPTFTAGDIGLYSMIPAAAPLTGINELFVTYADGSSLPITAALFSNTGYAYLPSGILIKWGYVAPSLPNPVTVTYDTTVKFTQVFSVMANAVNASGTDPNWYVTVNQTSVFTNTTFFTAVTTQRTTVGVPQAIQLFYLAIGY
jgi:hypothetical protein